MGLVWCRLPQEPLIRIFNHFAGAADKGPMAAAGVEPVVVHIAVVGQVVDIVERVVDNIELVVEPAVDNIGQVVDWRVVEYTLPVDEGGIQV
jgi:hypothetical protein